MFGYIVRKGKIGYNDSFESYSFENNIKELIRTKIFYEVGQRAIHLFPHEIDSLMIQFKQLGYIRMTEKNDGDSVFRGFQLTELGEHKLAKISVNKSFSDA